MTDTPPYPFPTLCLRWFGILTALWLLATGYWAYDSTEREWARLQHAVLSEPARRVHALQCAVGGPGLRSRCRLVRRQSLEQGVR
jgi:hypothetical protein